MKIAAQGGILPRGTDQDTWPRGIRPLPLDELDRAAKLDFQLGPFAAHERAKPGDILVIRVIRDREDDERHGLARKRPRVRRVMLPAVDAIGAGEFL